MHFSPFIMTINRVTHKIMSNFKERHRYLSLQHKHLRLQRTLKEDKTVLCSLEKKASSSRALRVANFMEIFNSCKWYIEQTCLIQVSHCIKKTKTFFCFHLNLFGRANSFPGAGFHMNFLVTLMSYKSSRYSKFRHGI